MRPGFTHITRHFQARPLLWVALFALFAIVPRAWSIDRAQSLRIDDGYHLTRGLLFLSRGFGPVDEVRQALNDPPLGEGLLALPAWVAGCRVSGTDVGPFVDQPISAEAIQRSVAVWKGVLWSGAVVVAFAWVRRLYGNPAAWAAAVLLATEPNLIAHIPPAALDILVAGVLIGACWLGWRLFEKPSVGRAVAASAAVTAALLTKHTAVLVPVIFLAFALTAQPWRGAPLLRQVRIRAGWFTLTALLAVLWLWPMTLFDVSHGWRPQWTAEQLARLPSALPAVLDRTMPAGIYARSFVDGAAHGAGGHPAFLLGEQRLFGWWYYFPVVASYKVPLPIIGLLLLATASLWARRPKRGELALLIPAVLYTLFLMNVKVNIGFRHFFPAYVFWLLLVTRGFAWPVVRGRVAVRAVGGFLVALTVVQSLAWHPNEMAFINRPVDRPWEAINDSNLEWGQTLKAAADWINRPDTPGAEEVTIAVFHTYDEADFARYLPAGVERLATDQPPTRRYVLTTPVRLMGVYSTDPDLAALRDQRPIARLAGGALLVFDRGPGQYDRS